MFTLFVVNSDLFFFSKQIYLSICWALFDKSLLYAMIWVYNVEQRSPRCHGVHSLGRETGLKEIDTQILHIYKLR